MTATPLIRLGAVCLSYRRTAEEVQALDAVTLEVHAGELLVVVGPSGSGKTSLLNVLCGWDEPESGDVTWSGPGGPEQRLDRLPWSAVASVPQTLGLLPELTLEENVDLPLRLAGDRARDRAVRWMTRLGIGDLRDRLPAEASLGQQQRAAVARALVADPDLVVADEPSAHLDAASAQLVYGALKGFTGRGGACVVATHDPIALESADRVVTMLDGAIQR